MKAVVNSTPLIALAIAEHLWLLPILFDRVLVPTSVYAEVTNQGSDHPGAEAVNQADWLIVETPKSSSIPIELLRLDEGERDVILLAIEREADWIVLDEKLARSIAIGMGIKCRHDKAIAPLA